MRLHRRIYIPIAVVLVLAIVVSLFLSFRVTINGDKGFMSISVNKAYATTLTNDPTTNTGSAWTNPTNAYTNNAAYANILANNPSGSNVWGNYGFTLTGDTINSVRVRYDAWSVGVASLSQTRVLTSDLTNTGGYTTSPLFSKVDETPPPNDVDYIVGVTQAGGQYTGGFSAFTVPTGSTIANVTVYFRMCDDVNGTNKGAACLKSGANYYSGTSTESPALGSPTTYSYAWTTNPNGGANWSAATVNALTEFGVTSVDFNPDVRFHMIYIEVNYTEYNDQIKVDVSWNGGANWSSTQDTTLTATEATTWYDVSGVTAWTGAKLANGQLQVRALAQSVNNAEVVRLDWLAVEVVYTFLGSIVNTPGGTLGFGIVLANTTYYAFGSAPSNPVQDAECTYTLTNNGSTAKINVHGHNATGGVGWTLTQAAPGLNTYRLTTYQTGTNPGNGIVLTTGDQQFIASLTGGGAHTHWDFSMETGTFGDGVEKTYIITLTAVTP